MTTTALDPGAAVTDPSEPGKQAEDVPWRRLAAVLPALLEDYPGWAYVLDCRPSYACPVTVGESWAAAQPGIQEDAEKAAAWQQENVAGSLGDAGRLASWGAESRLRTAALHAQVPIPVSAPAVADGESAAAGADSISGPGPGTPREPGPAPTGNEAA